MKQPTVADIVRQGHDYQSITGAICTAMKVKDHYYMTVAGTWAKETATFFERVWKKL